MSSLDALVKDLIVMYLVPVRDQPFRCAFFAIALSKSNETNLTNKDDCHLQRLLRPARRMLLEGETISSITAIN